MSVYDYLLETEVNTIINIIRIQCDSFAHHEENLSKPIDKELYKRLQKGRKAHDLTGEIYAGFFYPAYRIDGFDVYEVENGYYTQPELRKGNSVIHVYHSSNRLESSLANEKINDESIQFFCFMYTLDEKYKRKEVNVISFCDGMQEKETIYKQPTLKAVSCTSQQKLDTKGVKS